jgi:hypothetical protein
MVHLIKNILTNDECLYLAKKFDIEKRSRHSTDGDSYGNSFGFGPSYTFNVYMDKLKPTILKYFPDNTLLENVNAYVREYLNDSQLVKHVDRDDIGITISICLEYNIKTEWPLWANVDNKDVFFNMNVGDGVLLTHATETIHWRDKLICDENERVVQLFLHWKDVTALVKNKKTLI